MQSVKVGNETYAILVQSDDVKDGTEWFGKDYEPLQASRLNYKAGSKFRIHHHIMNPRTIKKTQEAFIIISGKIAVDIYDNNSTVWLGTLQASKGDAVLVYRGGHGVRIIEDSILYEIKSGQYTEPSEDKEFQKETK